MLDTRMTEQAIYNIVIEYAQALGFGKLAPHDLRRTFAKLAHQDGSTLDQISTIFGPRFNPDYRTLFGC